MTRRIAWSLVLLALFALNGSLGAKEVVPATSGKADEKGDIVWYDIKLLGVEGRGWTETENFYDRLPSKAKGVVRDPVWSLSKNSAGMSVRFITASPKISARWKLIKPALAMPHMPATGVSGLDLYARLPSGKWHWLAVGRPEAQQSTAALVSNIPAAEREYQLYLPLYNGVESVEIGLPKSETLIKAPLPERKPIVFYGTSITQGACASRPGMCYSAILGRWLNRPVINLGFSGNAKMEPEVANLLAELDPHIFVINALPNMVASEITERTVNLVQTIRRAHPDTPIVMCEDRTYANAILLPTVQQRNDSSRVAFKAEYDKLLQAGVKNLHYITGESQLSSEGDDTVDSSHPNDLGFWHQAEAFYKVLEPLAR